MSKETETHISEENHGHNQTYSKLDFAGKAADFFYPQNYLEKEVVDSDLPANLIPFKNVIGRDASRRYNFYFLNEHEIITANANTFEIININTKQRKLFHGTESGGVGCVTVHPDKKYFAVGECGEWPNIYIYEYNKNELITEKGESSIKLYRILRKGTERSYGALDFNISGDKLASVGGDPDYNMSIWNWRNESIILKAKAFSQEIFNVRFSKNFEGKLITSGIGHIKFWEMAKTFTGLKLQGELGKFGQIDLSDVSAFLEFPDGKVLSGTEYGTFLLWEGIFIKSHVMISREIKCHQGLIEYMSWENNNEEIMTGGHDGYIKWWLFDEIDNVLIDDNSLGFVSPIKEKLLINPLTHLPVKIINLIKEENFCLVQDGNGFILKIHNLGEDDMSIESIYDFHAGAVIKLSLMNHSPFLITQGADATSSLINIQTISQNFTKKIVLENQSADLEATSCDFAERDSHDDSVVMAVGYSIGLFRIYQYDSNKTQLELVNQIRAHEQAILKILISPDKSFLLTATIKEIFIFLMIDLDKIVPHCCFKRSEQEKIVDIDWHLDSQRILVALNTGSVEEIEIPRTFDSTKSYLMTNYYSRIFTVKLADGQIEKEDEKKKRRKKEVKIIDEPGPSPIISCKYANLYQEGDFFITAAKPYNDSLYLCNFDENVSNPKLRPINFWKLPLKASVREFFIKHLSNSFLFMCDNRGAVQIRHKKLLDKYVEIFPNLNSSAIKDITTSHDERTIAISYIDGTTFIYNINLEGINSCLESLLTPDNNINGSEFFKTFDFGNIIIPNYSENDTQKYLNEIKKNNFMVEIEKIKKKRQELENLISLEKEKKDEQEKEKLKLAEEKKNKSKARIQKLRDEYEKIINANSQMNEEIRLTPDELIVDEQYLGVVRNQQNENLEDIKHKYDWLKANVDYTIDKMTFFFLDSVRTPKIYIYSLKSNQYVTTLRCPNLPPDFVEEILKMNDDIEEFQRKVDFKSLNDRYERYLTDHDMNKDKEDDYVRMMTEKIRQRMMEYAIAERDNQHSGKRADSNKMIIKEEVKFTEEDLKELRKILEDKKLTKAEALRRYLDHREKGKRKHHSKNSNTTNRPERCPDSYYLKINYDFFYKEDNMKTVLLHKKKMFDFLKLLYEGREEFNRQVIELRSDKENLIKTLQDKKSQLNEVNNQLGIDPDQEKMEWMDFQMKEILEYPEREFNAKEDELEKYLHEKVQQDKELTQIFNYANQTLTSLNTSNANLAGGESSRDETTFNFLVNVKERRRVPNETNVESELRSINQIKLEHKKRKLISECQNLIEEFDKKVTTLRKLKTVTHFKQKLGEMELLIKHEEYTILRAFESDDNILIRKLEDLYVDYQDNIKNLHNCHSEIEQKEDELRRSKEDRKTKEQEFYSLIANEKDSREQLIKCFNQKRKIDLGGNVGDDKLDNEEELDLPRNISNQLKQDILALRDSRMHYDETLEKLANSINVKKKEKDNLIQAKKNLDRRLEEVRDKINMNERKKSRYLNLIDISIPLKIDQFCKLEVGKTENENQLEIHKMQTDISKGILISKTKLIELKNLLQEIKRQNMDLEKNNTEFDNKYDFKEREKKDLEKQLKELETNFQNEQILKFGLVIDFDHLLKASENTIIDKLEFEYKLLKREADKQIDEYKNRIDELKMELKGELSDNTHLLNRIKDGLEKNQTLDKRLNEKNNEIDKKSEKKFVMFNIQEKKEKLKEILKLLQQQMEALKKEIDIFRRKGGHIYSTIASNLS